MIRRFAFLSLILGSLAGVGGSTAQAYEPGFNFAFGYSVGQMNQFRNRLPAPPYFSVYPPVYYGQRYERPYGESPFASWPLLQASADYHARPKDAPVMFANPHAATETPCTSCGQSVTAAPAAELGKMVTVENPFAVGASKVAASE